MGRTQRERILIVAAHPDDEVLGCGGTAAKLATEGKGVFALILGEGITARDETRNRVDRELEIQDLKKQTTEADSILKMRDSFVFDFPDNSISSTTAGIVSEEVV